MSNSVDLLPFFVDSRRTLSNCCRSCVKLRRYFVDLEQECWGGGALVGSSSYVKMKRKENRSFECSSELIKDGLGSVDNNVVSETLTYLMIQCDSFSSISGHILLIYQNGIEWFHKVYRVIQNKAAPYLVKMRNGPWKLRIAFSNTIYSTIIWRVSWSTIDYLRLNESLCKMSSIYFWPFLGDFGVITHVTYGSSKKFKI